MEDRTEKSFTPRGGRLASSFHSGFVRRWQPFRCPIDPWAPGSDPENSATGVNPPAGVVVARWRWQRLRRARSIARSRARLDGNPARRTTDWVVRSRCRPRPRRPRTRLPSRYCASAGRPVGPAALYTRWVSRFAALDSAASTRTGCSSEAAAVPTAPILFRPPPSSRNSPFLQRGRASGHADQLAALCRHRVQYRQRPAGPGCPACRAADGLATAPGGDRPIVSIWLSVWLFAEYSPRTPRSSRSRPARSRR